MDIDVTQLHPNIFLKKSKSMQENGFEREVHVQKGTRIL